MQYHVKMTDAMIMTWSQSWSRKTGELSALPPSVQALEAMRQKMPQRIPAMRKVAEQLYSVWINGLFRN